RERIWIQFDDGVYGRALLVNLRDAVEIFLGDRAGRELSRRHAILEIRNRDFVEIEGFDICRRLFESWSCESRRGERGRPQHRGGPEEFSATQFGGDVFFMF